MDLKVYYGVIDITHKVLQYCKYNTIIFIPAGIKNRTNIIDITQKEDFIISINNIITKYGNNINIYIDLNINKVYHASNKNIITTIPKIIIDIVESCIALQSIHKYLKLMYGKFQDEFPEQLMTMRYLKGHEKVLEIGGNIGRNSLIIASILDCYDNKNFVVIESDNIIARQLIVNRNINNLQFRIINAALSNRKLIQKGWDTICSDKLLPGYKKVNTITWKRLNIMCKINFDTLILDCEGAFYYILMDMPEILNNIKLIIMENDYHDISHKQYIDTILKENNFYVDYSEKGGWGPCYDYFFEVWKKLI